MLGCCCRTVPLPGPTAFCVSCPLTQTFAAQLPPPSWQAPSGRSLPAFPAITARLAFPRPPQCCAACLRCVLGVVAGSLPFLSVGRTPRRPTLLALLAIASSAMAPWASIVLSGSLTVSLTRVLLKTGPAGGSVPPPGQSMTTLPSLTGSMQPPLLGGQWRKKKKASAAIKTLTSMSGRLMTGA